MATRRELKQAVGERYRAAGRWERRHILDEFTRATGYHRKHALRVLHRPVCTTAAARGGESTMRRCGRRWHCCGKRPTASAANG